MSIVLIFSTGLIVSSCGVSKGHVFYTDTQDSASNTLIRNLKFSGLKGKLASEEYLKTHLQGLKRKLVSSTLYVFRFSSDLEVHTFDGERMDPNSEVLSILRKAFPEDHKNLEAVTDLSGEFVAGYEIDNIPTKSIGEETWLVYNKETGVYFLYQNALPEKTVKNGYPEKFETKPCRTDRVFN